MKLPDRIKILEVRVLDIQREKQSDGAQIVARAWIENMTRRAEEADTPHEEHDSPVAFICRYLGVAVRDFRSMLRERVGFAN